MGFGMPLAPFPWSVDMDSIGKQWTNSISILDGSGTIAHVCHLTRGYGNSEDEPYSMDNARLIAAAPELLAACDAARLCLKNRDQDPTEAKVYDALRFVIRKATGK